MNYLTSLLLLSTNTFIQPTVTIVTTTINNSIVLETSTIDPNLTTTEYDLHDNNSSFVKLNEVYLSDSSDGSTDEDGEFEGQNTDDTGSTCDSCDSTDNDSDSEDDRVFVHGYTVTTTITTTTTSYGHYPRPNDYFENAANKGFFHSALEPVKKLQWGIHTSKPGKSYRRPFRKFHRTGGGAFKKNDNFINRRVTVTKSITKYVAMPTVKPLPIQQDTGTVHFGLQSSKTRPQRGTSSLKLIERVPTNYIPITSESFTPEATLTHVVPYITNSVIYYPTNGNDIDDITFPIRFIRTLISGEYSVLPIEGSTIYLGYPIESSTSLRYSSIRLARPLRTKRRRPRSKTKTTESPTYVSSTGEVESLSWSDFGSTSWIDDEVEQSLGLWSSSDVQTSLMDDGDGYLNDESIDTESVVSLSSTSPLTSKPSTSWLASSFSNEPISYHTSTSYSSKLYVQPSRSKTTMKETLLTDVTKIHIISEVTVPTTTTTTRWIEITPQVPTAVKSATSNTPTNKETKSKKFSFPRFRTRKSRSSNGSSTIPESSQLRNSSIAYNSTVAQTSPNVVHETVLVGVDERITDVDYPQQTKLDQHSFTGVVLPSRKFIFRSMSNLPNCEFSTYMLVFLLIVPLLGLLCL